MPRNRPGRVRTESLVRDAAWIDSDVVTGLSGAARDEIRRIELRKSYLWPGATAQSLVRWRDFVHHPRRRLWDPDVEGCPEWACCGDPWQAREYLEAVLVTMSRRRSGELRARVTALDAHY